MASEGWVHTYPPSPLVCQSTGACLGVGELGRTMLWKEALVPPLASRIAGPEAPIALQK